MEIQIQEKSNQSMNHYVLDYKKELFWCWVITNNNKPSETYVLSNYNDVTILLKFLRTEEKEKDIPENIQKIIEKSKTVEEIMKKKNQKTLFWCVDIQDDFMKPDGLLYIKDAETIIPRLQATVKKFTDTNVTKIFTMDWHFPNSEELSDKPDFLTKFPPHCMADTNGACIIDEIGEMIYPMNVEVIDWFNIYNYQDLCQIAKEKTIILTKDKFDVFTGNRYTDKLLEIIKPDVVYVSGVASNVCVDFAVMGLLQRGIKVYVIVDTIKKLPNIPIAPIIEKWIKNGATLI